MPQTFSSLAFRSHLQVIAVVVPDYGWGGCLINGHSKEYPAESHVRWHSYSDAYFSAHLGANLTCTHGS